jgi:hypothetical protein
MGNRRHSGDAKRELASILKWSLYSGLFVVGVELITGGFGILSGLWTIPSLKILSFIILGGFALGFLGILSWLMESSYYLGSRKKDVM